MKAKDSIRRVLDNGLAKKAEINFPSENIPIYQEDANPGNSGDLLQYSEPWGGSQNRPYLDANKPNDLEQDKPMSYQGERPEVFQNGAPPEEFPVSTTNAIGQGWEKSPDPGAGEGTEPASGSVFVKPRGDGGDPFLLGVEPYNIGEPYEQGVAEEQTFSDRVYAYASDECGDLSMKNIDKGSVHRVVEAAIKKSSVGNNHYKIKVASLMDLYSFARISQGTLIHKSSNELWSISVGDDGSAIIEKQFDDNGKPVAG